MAVSAPTEGPDRLVAQVQDLQEQMAEAGSSVPGGLAEELVSAVVQMYGEGLERIMAVLSAAGAEGAAIATELADDALVATLLLIHDLHPVPLEVRVNQALEHVRPYMESHGGNVELLSLEDGVACLRLQGSCSDCSASSVTLELAIKQALEEAAPDLEALEVEGVAEPPPLPGSPPPTAGPAAAPTWVAADRLARLAEGSLGTVEVAGAALVVANVEGTLLAYHDRCAGCGGPLHDGTLEGGALRCPGCSRSFFLPRAGRSMDDERIQLEPVPLLRERDHVKVALET